MARRSWLPVDGVIVLDKPLTLSSNDALQRVRRAYRARKAGHGGTLDPLATGVLPIAFGKATRFLHDLVEAEKIYTATLTLGQRSNTGDGEGEITDTPGYVSGVPASQNIEQVLAEFIGPIMQRAPMYSALKHQGKPLYEYARAGIKLDLPPRSVTIHECSLVSVGLDQLQIRIRCSKGTYIRVLAEDIGDRLGCGAYLSGLRRDAVGRFDLGQSVTLETLENAAMHASDEAPHAGLPPLSPVDEMVRELPEVSLDDAAARQFTNGQAVALAPMAIDDDHSSAHADESRWRVYGDGRFLGLGRRQARMLSPFKVIPDTAV
ncbi:MAG: tRNA pseudouridine(55) synthase TruB [Burkholderiaceae bacterium]